jgi:hypothetical protein
MTSNNSNRNRNTSNRSSQSRSRSIMHTTAVSLMVGMMALQQQAQSANAFVQHQNQHQQPMMVNTFPQSPLFASSNVDANVDAGGSGNGSGHIMAFPPELQQALERKNASRQKFGLEPMTAPQFLEMQSQIAEMEQEQVSKIQQQQQQNLSRASSSSPVETLKQLFQSTLLEDTCYSSFDCESPKVCCDLGLKKMCCSNGLLEVRHEYILVPVTVDMRP